MPLQKKKYQQVILYLCHKLGGEIRGKKKLAKLLYFVDFDFYEKFQKSITGDVYKAYPKGPLPSALNEIIEEMVAKKTLLSKNIQEWEGYAPTEVYKIKNAPEISMLSAQEKKMIERVAKKYGNLNGEQLAELSHSEAPYTATEPRKEIPYEFTYYRGTDFSDL